MSQQTSSMLLYFGILALAFYFLIIRPQQQRQRQQRELLASVKSGDRVITASGIFGRVVSIDADVVMLEVAQDVVIEIAKGAVAQIVDSFSAPAGPEGHEHD